MVRGCGEVPPHKLAVLEEKRLALGETKGLRHAERVGDGAVLVGQQIEWQAELVLERLLSLRGVVAHPDHLHALGAEFGECVAKTARLPGASGGIGFRIEVDQQPALRAGFGEIGRFSVLVDLRGRRQCRPLGERLGRGGHHGATGECGEYP